MHWNMGRSKLEETQHLLLSATYSRSACSLCVKKPNFGDDVEEGYFTNKAFPKLQRVGNPYFL